MKLRRTVPQIERFSRHIVEDKNGCWIWVGAKSPGGYALMGVGRADMGIMRAHRFSFEYFIGPIPNGKELDHLCRVRACVNPFHVEPVSRRENFLRGNHWADRAFLTDTCRRGHSLADCYHNHGYRQCRICTLAKYDPAARRRRYLSQKGRHA